MLANLIFKIFLKLTCVFKNLTTIESNTTQHLECRHTYLGYDPIAVGTMLQHSLSTSYHYTSLYKFRGLDASVTSTKI